MAYALLLMGVDIGVYKTFKLVPHKKGFNSDTWSKGFVISNVGRCCIGYPDPNWEKFIDEVVSLVDS
jgi:hypothetical protein